MIILLIIVFVIAGVYLVMISAFYVGLKKVLSKSTVEGESRAALSVVIPFRNESESLPVLLDALSRQTLSGMRYEVILVDDHSSDGSIAVINDFRNRFIRLISVTTPEGVIGKKAALVYGVNLAQHPIIVFTDADCVPEEQWLETIVDKFSNDVDFLVGPVIQVPTKGFVEEIQSLEYSSLLASAAGSCGVGHPVIASSANLAFRKSFIEANSSSMMGAIASGDDMFLLHSAKRRGCKIDFIGDSCAIVKTSTEPNLRRALNQRRRWASKSVYYKDFDTILTSIAVFAFNLLLIGLAIASFILVKYLLILICLLCVKSSVDFLLLKRYLRFTKQENLLKVFIPLQLLYPLYVFYSFFGGVLFKATWKDRQIR